MKNTEICIPELFKGIGLSSSTYEFNSSLEQMLLIGIWLILIIELGKQFGDAQQQDDEQQRETKHRGGIHKRQPQAGHDEQGTINKINVLPSQTKLTPINIMVVDTMSAVKSRRLLKVILDSGPTTTLINKECLHKNCKTCKTSKSRMVNTLAGSYNTSEMVVMCNLRLPELDKNHNVDQQKAFVFESKTCKVIQLDLII